MAIAAACLAPVRSLVTLATPWRFSGFGADALGTLARLWESAQPGVAALKLLPMEVLQAAFWNLDPHRTIAKFEDFADLPRGSSEERTFVTLEDWANDGPPLPVAAAREMFEQLIAEDLPGTGRWVVGDKTVDPAQLSCPQLHIISSTDRIVPAASAVAVGDRRTLEQGHVGMIVGARARTNLWDPLDGWLSQCSKG